MVSSPRARCNRRVIAATIAIAALLLPVTSYAYKAYKKPKKHFLSWESVNAHEKYMPWRKILRPEREFNVKKIKTIRLKRPTFWNKKPVQFSTPVLDGELMFVGNNASRFYAIQTSKNKKIWKVETDGGIEAPAAVDGTYVYVGDIKGHAYSFDQKTGELRWKVRLGSEILGAPLPIGARVYFVTLDGRLFALQKSTGQEIWHTDAMERTVGFTVRRQSSPIYFNGRIIFGTSRGTLIAYNEDGSIGWVRLLGLPQAQVMDVDSKPLIVNGRLYAASADGELFCLDPQDANIIWSINAGGANDLLYHQGKFFASGQGKLSSIDPEYGSVFWEQDLEVPGISSPAGGQGFIAVANTKDKIYIIDSRNGDVVFERFIGKGSFGDPIVTGDKLYILSNSSKLFSFRVKEKVKKEKKKKKIVNSE